MRIFGQRGMRRARFPLDYRYRSAGALIVILMLSIAATAAEKHLVSTEVGDKRWNDKFEQLRRLDRKLRETFPAAFQDEPAAYVRPPIEAGSTVDLYEAMLGRELSAISATVNRIAASRTAKEDDAARSFRRTVRTRTHTYSIDLPASATVENVSVRLGNFGKTDIVNPRIVANGKRDWFDVESIKREALAGAKTDRDKAIAIWRFLAGNRYHYTPAHNSFELHDPVRFLNVYGYGFCDDSAANYAALARSADLGGRVWGLSGHVVAEAYYDDAWHHFDPDGRAYYLKQDNRTIPSVEEIAAAPDLLKNAVTVDGLNYSREKLADLYTTTDNNQVSDWYRQTSSTSHKMAFTLRPGESIVRYWQPRGWFFTSRYFEEPPKYGCGDWIYEPPLEKTMFRSGAAELNHVDIGAANRDPAILATAADASFTHKFQMPYPLLDGWVELDYQSTGAKNAIGIEIAAGDSLFREAWRGGGEGRRNVIVPIGCFFPNGYGAPAYGCRIRVTMKKAGGTPAIAKLRYRFAFQVAPASLPALEPGKNEIRVWVEGEIEPELEVEYRYSLGSRM